VRPHRRPYFVGFGLGCNPPDAIFHYEETELPVDKMTDAARGPFTAIQQHVPRLAQNRNVRAHEIAIWLIG